MIMEIIINNVTCYVAHFSQIECMERAERLHPGYHFVRWWTRDEIIIKLSEHKEEN